MIYWDNGKDMETTTLGLYRVWSFEGYLTLLGGYLVGKKGIYI